MTLLRFETRISASATTVFDLSRSVDVHMQSTARTLEKAIDGKMHGLLELGEEVTWKGRHFGFWLTHRSRISQMEAPCRFVDEMVAGKFKTFRHEHRFEQSQGITIMYDAIAYETPFGIFGRAFDRFVLREHLSQLIRTRNQAIKHLAENQA